jgi:hypothetical protein
MSDVDASSVFRTLEVPAPDPRAIDPSPALQRALAAGWQIGGVTSAVDEVDQMHLLVVLYRNPRAEPAAQAPIAHRPRWMEWSVGGLLVALVVWLGVAFVVGMWPR